MRFISYAQEFEDLIIYVVMKDYVTNGNYIDVGANDPVRFSVTKVFYDMGWNGINIEPLEDKCELLMKERPRDVNLCLGVGEADGELKMAVDGMASSFATDVQSKMGLSEERYITKKITTLQRIVDIWGKEETHFLKIDVEGFEREVLLGTDFTRFRPWLIVMESTEPGTNIPCHQKWEDILLQNHYSMAFQYGINRYYVADERSFLKSGFEKIVPFIKNNLCYVIKMNDVTIEA